MNVFIRLKRITALTLFVCLLFLCGCGTKSEENTSINVGVGKITGNFNPFYADEDGDLSVVNQVFDKIQRRGTDDKLINLAGSISYEYVGDTQVKYTVTVRDDLYFSNGNNVTIDDVIFFYYFISDATYDGIYSDFYLNDIVGLKEYYYDDPDYEQNKTTLDLFDSGSADSDYVKSNYADGNDVNSISGIKRIDDYTCTVLFNSRNINAVSELNVPIVSKSFYNENYIKGNAEKVRSFTSDAMGCGPYSIKSYDKANNSVTLSANTYCDSVPHFSEVTMLQCDDKSAADMINSGDIDVVSVDGYSTTDSALSSESLRTFVTNKDEYISLCVNTKRISNPEVRCQLLSIIDPYSYVDESLGKYYTKIYRPLSIRFDEYPDDSTAYFSSGADVSLIKSQIQSINLYVSSDEFMKGLADAVKSSLSLYGISCSVTSCSESELVSAVKSGKADMWLASVSDGATCDKYDYYNSVGTMNYTGVSDETIDSKTAEIREAVGYKDKSLSMSSLLDLIMAQGAELPICQRQVITIYNSSVFSQEALNKVSGYDGFDYALRVLY